MKRKEKVESRLKRKKRIRKNKIESVAFNKIRISFKIKSAIK